MLFLNIVNRSMAGNLNKLWGFGVSVISLLVWISPTSAPAAAPGKPVPIECEGLAWIHPCQRILIFLMRPAGNQTQETACFSAAGPRIGRACAASDPPFKAISLGDETSLTLSAESRLRFDPFTNGQQTLGNDFQQTVLRCCRWRSGAMSFLHRILDPLKNL